MSTRYLSDSPGGQKKASDPLDLIGAYHMDAVSPALFFYRAPVSETVQHKQVRRING